MFLQCAAFVCLLQISLSIASDPLYPELRSSLQSYQDNSRCYPDIGEWVLMYRSYYYDKYFGGTEKCVKYNRYGTYENYSTQCTFRFGKKESINGTLTLSSSPCYTCKNRKTFVPFGENAAGESFHAIYMDCESCFVGRHPYAGNGQGCSLWRRYDSMARPNDCCEFIYDENCGSSPKYKMYDSTCSW